MSTRIVVTGTDTGIGKTVFSAALAGALDGFYWKPIQAGLDDETDTQTVLRLSGLAAERVLPEAYRLRTPASPHLAAELDGVTIEHQALLVPEKDRPLVVEGAGGLLVPLTRTITYLDLMARWRIPVVLCARTALGTINHSLLSVEALRARGVAMLGIAFIGEENVESERIITEMGKVRRLGRLPHVAPLTRDTLREAFADGFAIDDFLKGPA
ncbi:dethiobiotin synthase [Nitrobacter hamburgensis X14]|uniref:ATP-dependent dethiobiotin synthetase BioD n=1 Tax=Nitrobacter hamburgensis (strain DSM 10229 / NCIMB 13809 / X14) TaxID=323097 RepID=BIOD_NITHX|nr:dethiobiotin synthase [Nitrobacter hamburgensis]Q1QJL1.1 RecName: Full=ATP-dependent dethiobiotin synthetase BioD; AltName: Full=DTB synthetase; Short=DTBS; AltName: Full=Dethiobiotin synthase [Nitrobacter hamburgensis X14]ABE63586.1 dethiobiotin synthase [Nitrobacter hamburgensis X14]